MEKITIHHAFNGFLYAPLFAAFCMDLFPRDTNLSYATSDEDAIQKLCGAPPECPTFAICDPFSTDLQRVIANASQESVRVVGSLIDRLPLWVYMSDETVHHAASEADLVRTAVKKIVCYKSGTTGHIIAQRIRKEMGLPETALSPVAFGTEFISALDDKTCVVTADVLRLVHYKIPSRNTNVLFNYPMHAPPDLKPFLFTGILTLQTTINNNLVAVISVLDAIRDSLQQLSYPRVDQEYVSKLVAWFDKTDARSSVDNSPFEDLKLTTAAEKEQLVRDSLAYLHRQSIYELELQPDPASLKLALNNARNVWITQRGGTYTEDRDDYERVPTLLLRPTWRGDIERLFAEAAAKAVEAVPDVPPTPERTPPAGIDDDEPGSGSHADGEKASTDPARNDAAGAEDVRLFTVIMRVSQTVSLVILTVAAIFTFFAAIPGGTTHIDRVGFITSLILFGLQSVIYLAADKLNADKLIGKIEVKRVFIAFWFAAFLGWVPLLVGAVQAAK